MTCAVPVPLAVVAATVMTSEPKATGTETEYAPDASAVVDANDVAPPESVPVELAETWAPGAVVPETVVEPDTA